MTAFLAHFDVMPLFYGLVMFAGLAYTWQKLITGKLVSVAIDVGVFWLVFSLHGHSMTGGFAAMVAAALASMTFPFMLRRAFR